MTAHSPPAQMKAATLLKQQAKRANLHQWGEETFIVD